MQKFTSCSPEFIAFAKQWFEAGWSTSSLAGRVYGGYNKYLLWIKENEDLRELHEKHRNYPRTKMKTTRSKNGKDKKKFVRPVKRSQEH